MNKKQERVRLLEVQCERLQRRIDSWTPRSNRYSWMRVGSMLGGVALSVVAWFVVAWWLALPLFALTIIVYAVLAHYNGLLDGSIARHRLWKYIKEAHIARIKLDWEHIPAAHYEGPQTEHPFEFDIDITGPRSLHQLLNTAISRDGTLRLRDWLLNTTPDLESTRQRQELVQELLPLTLFRDKLLLKSLLAAGRAKEQLEGGRLLSWLKKQDPPSALRALFWGSLALNILTVILLAGTLFLALPQLWIFSLVASILLFFGTGNIRGDIFDDATYLRYSFATLSSIFAFLEKYPYGQHLRLKALCSVYFREPTYSPSQLLKSTSRISEAATLKNNGIVWLLVNAFVPWDLYCAYRLRRYKAEIAARLPAWLDTWFELEALSSLATFAYLNPEYIQPEISAPAEQKAQPVFQASGLGHPLLVVEKKVTNDFTLQELGSVVIITGSNMAGKSTFLRTLGVNLCLAYAGGPVNAQTFQTSLFRLFTCIRVTDSVTDGYSYFYAEVRRLRALLTALEEPEALPLFFLVDEIFKGTNNRERLIGSRSYVRATVGRNCVGLISTHDLELVKLADTLPDVQNKHFREEVIDGRLVFDYMLRIGPCPTTNALKIMQMEGLPIDDMPALI